MKEWVVETVSAIQGLVLEMGEQRGGASPQRRLWTSFALVLLFTKYAIQPKE